MILFCCKYYLLLTEQINKIIEEERNILRTKSGKIKNADIENNINHNNKKKSVIHDSPLLINKSNKKLNKRKKKKIKMKKRSKTTSKRKNCNCNITSFS